MHLWLCMLSLYIYSSATVFVIVGGQPTTDDDHRDNRDELIDTVASLKTQLAELVDAKVDTQARLANVVAELVQARAETRTQLANVVADNTALRTKVSNLEARVTGLAARVGTCLKIISQKKIRCNSKSVSYTHLTLPTNREV